MLIFQNFSSKFEIENFNLNICVFYGVMIPPGCAQTVVQVSESVRQCGRVALLK